jgi:hormone-sensitive lipase
MTINEGMRIPDGLLLVYPALNLSKKAFSPSLLLAQDDPLISFSFLKLCQEAYIGESGANPDTDWRLSPCYAPDSMLK